MFLGCQTVIWVRTRTGMPPQTVLIEQASTQACIFRKLPAPAEVALQVLHRRRREPNRYQRRRRDLLAYHIDVAQVAT